MSKILEIKKNQLEGTVKHIDQDSRKRYQRAIGRCKSKNKLRNNIKNGQVKQSATIQKRKKLYTMYFQRINSWSIDYARHEISVQYKLYQRWKGSNAYFRVVFLF
jgi:hypothetical protein